MLISFNCICQEHNNSLRSIILYTISVSAITATIKMGLPGAGALCCLVCSLTCSAGWQHGMPWRFKRNPNPGLLAAGQSRLSPDAEAGADIESNLHNDIQSPLQGSDASGSGPTEHHVYYRQYLKSLRRMLNRSGRAGSRRALATVTKSRRFSLPEPKPQYEEEDFAAVIGGFNIFV